MPVFGFDFGTTNSLVSCVAGDRVISFLDQEGQPFPSVVCYEGSQTIVGREAKERLGAAGLDIQGNVIPSPKTLLGRESVFVDGVARSPVDVVADVVKFVKREAESSRKLPGAAIDRAVVTIPVTMEGYRRAALRDAFRLAGIGIAQFVHEPLAALYGYLRSEKDYAAALRRYDRQLLLVYDWGGGTLDLTLCRLVDGMLVQIRNDGTDEVGGDVFDDEIKNEVVRRVAKKRSIQESVSISDSSMVRLKHRCERAKIDLSTRPRAQLFVTHFFRGLEDADLDYALSREEMEDIVRPLLDKGLARIEKLMREAGISPAQVSLCLATGGMSNMPVIKQRLHELFGPQRVHVSDRSASLIAEGAAWVAHDAARLSLAKNVELLLARNSQMPLIHAGTQMPREGEVMQAEFNLYCADPRDGIAKLQLQSPLRPGRKVLPGDPRTVLDSLVVKVDKAAKPFFERLQLDVLVDDNLVLHARGRSLNKKGTDATEVHNLEFGLALPGAGGGDDVDDDHTFNTQGDAQHEFGALALRSNVADKVDEALVPGELLYQHNPQYFDVRSKPPQIQVDERLYYEPCAICGRPSNDPLCQCGSALAQYEAWSGDTYEAFRSGEVRRS